MATIGSLVVNLTANRQGLSRGLAGAAGDVRGFANQVKAGAKSLVAFGAAMVGLSSAGAAIGFGVKLAAEVEQAEAQFTTLLRSASAAQEVLRDLEEFAASTPFELAGLRDAARVLIAFGFAQDELMGRMQMLGDIAAGTGKPIGDFVDIFGKVKASGRASMEEINRLAERGVPIYKALADTMRVPESAIRQLVSTGRVGFAELDSALQSTVNSGGIFAGGMKRQSTTIMGLWSTLKDNLSFILQDLGQEIFEAFDIKSIMVQAIAMVQWFRSVIGDVVQVVLRLGRYVLFAATAFGAWKAALLAYSIAQRAATAAAVFFQAVTLSPKAFAKVLAGIAAAGIAVGIMDAQLRKAGESARQAATDAAEAANEIEKTANAAAEAAGKSGEKPKKLDIGSIEEDLKAVNARIAELRSVGEEAYAGIPQVIQRETDAALGKVSETIGQWQQETIDPVYQLRRALAEVLRLQEETGAKHAEGAILGLKEEIANATGLTAELERVEKQIAELKGQTRADELLELGALPEQVAELRDRMRELQTVKATVDLTSDLGDLQDELDLLTGKVTEADLALREFGRTGVDPALFEDYRRLTAEIEEAKKAKEQEQEAKRERDRHQKELADRGRSLTESLRTPFERMQAEIAEAQRLLSAGTITSQTFDRAKARAEQDFRRSRETDEPVSALRRGSAEAYSAIFAAMRGQQNDPQKKTAQNTAEATTELKNVNLALQNTNRLLQSGDVQVVSSLT